MTQVTSANANAYTSDALKQYDIDEKKPKEENINELGKDDFLQLMITKLNNQDPLKPQDDAQFIAELAQFSTVEGIQNMSKGFDSLATAYKSSQALQASSLVGGAVTLDGNDEGSLRLGELVYGMAEIPKETTDIRLQIKNEEGAWVEDIELTDLPKNVEEIIFKWDGANLEVNGELADIDYEKFEQDENGNIIPHAPGEYTFKIIGNVVGQAEDMDISISRRVDSVTIKGNNDVQLNLAGGKTASMDEVKQINAVY